MWIQQLRHHGTEVTRKVVRGLNIRTRTKTRTETTAVTTSMDITDLVVTKRNESLLVGDHNTYHAKLTRRLLNLRRQLGRTQPSGKRYQAPAPITPEDIAGNNAYA